MRDLTKTFKALSDENRLRILNMLIHKTLCVCEITEILQLATSTVSKHLSILREAGFVNDNKDGKWVNYFLNNVADEHINALITFLTEWFKDNKTAEEDISKLDNINRNYICGVKYS